MPRFMQMHTYMSRILKRIVRWAWLGLIISINVSIISTIYEDLLLTIAVPALICLVLPNACLYSKWVNHGNEAEWEDVAEEEVVE